MKLRPEQLSQHLSKTLSSLYLISSDVSLLLEESANQIRKVAKQQGYTERLVFTVSASFDWNELLTSTDTLSLFSDKKLLELRLPTGKPGKDGAKILKAYAERPPKDTLLLIISGKIDAATQKTAWFKTLEKAGVTVPIWPIDKNQLPGWVKQRLGQAGYQASNEICALITENVEGNLLAVKQLIDKIQLIYPAGTLRLDNIIELLSDQSRYDVFKLVDAILENNLSRTLHILSSLKAEGAEPAMILWALHREIRQLAQMRYALDHNESLQTLMTQFRIWQNRKPLIQQTLHRCSTKQLQGLLGNASQIDQIIKGARTGNVWLHLEQLILSLTANTAIPIEENTYAR